MACARRLFAFLLTAAILGSVAFARIPSLQSSGTILASATVSSPVGLTGIRSATTTGMPTTTTQTDYSGQWYLHAVRPESVHMEVWFEEENGTYARGMISTESNHLVTLAASSDVTKSTQSVVLNLITTAD